jgi:hypothetical protein
MAYTIIKSNGQVLTTIADGTINTTSTSLGLPGRNYAGYGQALDTNFVHLVENFADSTPPPNPLKGQLWYDTNDNTLKVCPADGTTVAANWLSLTATSSGGSTTFGQVTVTGNIGAGNVNVTNTITAANAVFQNLSVSVGANIQSANIITGNIGTLTTTLITTGGSPANTTAGTIIGTWTANGGGTANGVAGTTMWVTNGNLVITGATPIGIKTDNYYYANGVSVFGGGVAYSNSNVAAYLPTYVGNVGSAGGATKFNGNVLSTGGAGTAGEITGNWTLTAGSRLQATYADLAERFEADAEYDAGTVVELGGDKEITAVKYELSEDVFGVVSNTAAYLMNAGAGDDKSHPPIAVSGRVAVKVTGRVNKGDRLVSAGNGIARAAKDGEATAFNTIGRALVDKVSDGDGTVEAIVIIR